MTPIQFMGQSSARTRCGRSLFIDWIDLLNLTLGSDLVLVTLLYG